MKRPSVTCSRRGATATVILRGAAGNRIDRQLGQELRATAEELAAADNISVVIVRSGGRDFCLGATAIDDPLADWASAVAAIPQPVIAVVQGDAVDAGAELALIADLRLCARTARFRFGHLLDHRLPAHGATQRLPRAVGRMRAMELLLSGRWIGAAEAVKIGLATEVRAPEHLARSANDLARNLAAKGPLALRYAKEAICAGSDMTLSQGIRLEQDLYVLLQTTEDRREGVDSFLANRPPVFRGR